MDMRRALHVPSQYIEAVINDNAPRDGMGPDRVRRTFRSLARNNVKDATAKTVGLDIVGEGSASGGTARNVAADYIAYLRRLYVIEDLSGWAPPIKARERLRTKPKRYFVDPPLAVAELPDGRWGAMEARLGEDKVDEAVSSLRALKRAATVNAKMRQRDPSFLMVLVGNGAFARRVDEDVYVVPLSALGR